MCVHRGHCRSPPVLYDGFDSILRIAIVVYMGDFRIAGHFGLLKIEILNHSKLTGTCLFRVRTYSSCL